MQSVKSLPEGFSVQFLMISCDVSSLLCFFCPAKLILGNRNHVGQSRTQVNSFNNVLLHKKQLLRLRQVKIRLADMVRPLQKFFQACCFFFLPSTCPFFSNADESAKYFCAQTHKKQTYSQMQLWVQIHQLHLRAASLSLLGGKINHPSSRMRQFVEPQSNLGILFSPLKLCFFFCFCGLYFKTTRWIKKL